MCGLMPIDINSDPVGTAYRLSYYVHVVNEYNGHTITLNAFI